MHNKLTINQVAKLCGITVRTLHYYDEINLLSPAAVADNGYRLYDEENLSKLQEILFFKELDIPLKEIKAIFSNPEYDKNNALSKHKKLLELKRNRLNKIIQLLDDNLNLEKISLKEFDMTNIKEHIEKYSREAQERWGDSATYKQSVKKTCRYSDEDWQKINNVSANIFADFVACMKKEQDCKSADALVQDWQNHITKYFYECTDEILLGLADMYVYDERFKENMDKHGEGVTEFISNSIKNYLQKT